MLLPKLEHWLFALGSDQDTSAPSAHNDPRRTAASAWSLLNTPNDTTDQHCTKGQCPNSQYRSEILTRKFNDEIAGGLVQLIDFVVMSALTLGLEAQAHTDAPMNSLHRQKLVAHWHVAARRHLTVARLIGSSLLTLCAISVPALAQTGPAPAGLTPDQQAIIDKIRKPSEGENKTFVEAPKDPIADKVILPLPGGKSVTVVRKGSVVQRDGSIAWRGEVEETGERALLMVWGNALLTGYFAYDGTIYTVESLGGGLHALAEMDRHKLPLDHPADATRDSAQIPVRTEAETPRPIQPEPTIAPLSEQTRQALEAKNIIIDVMILYTGNVTKHYVRDPEDLLALAIEEANESFRNSGLGNIKLRLVHTQLIKYDGSEGDQFNHLYRMVDGIGVFKDVKKLRNEKNADIVGLIIDNPSGCGQSTRIGASSDEAFFVVHHACATVTMSIAHEIGHILGARHDRFVDESDSYAHGYVHGTKWRDLMSYNKGCGNCPRIPHWSNPRIKYNGEATGTHAADNARLILETADRVANFRYLVGP